MFLIVKEQISEDYARWRRLLGGVWFTIVEKDVIIIPMNEMIFFFHIILVVFFTLAGLMVGKEALITFVSLQAVLANLFVLKQMTLFGFNVTCSDVFSVGCILGINLLNEHFGKKVAKQAVWLSFGAILIFGVMSQVHLFYKPSPHDVTQVHFLKLLSPAPRILLASFIAFFVSGQFDVKFYAFLKTLFQGRLLFVRSIVSLAATQFLDTVLFSFLGLYGILASITDVIFLSFLVKFTIIACATPFSILSKKLLGERNEV